MIRTEVAIIGGGPAGLSAAIAASSLGAKVLIIDRNPQVGGQLVKQTHKFFGSQKEHASTRGVDIAKILFERLKDNPNVEFLYNTTALGFYKEDKIISAEVDEKKYIKIKADRTIVATGAGEKFLAFPNNDLPGIYGAGAVQTLMNQHGVVPGNNVLMVGAGNIGLIVSYQLMQAGVNVKAIIDAAPNIGGYLVHAAKIRRLGIPILTSHTIKSAYGKDSVERATVVRLDENWKPVEGSERVFNVDVICIAVGLTPLGELLWQVGCEMKYIPEFGGHVPVRNESLETTVSGVFVAGDVSGVEEASAAMVEGRLAGAAAVMSLGLNIEKAEELVKEATEDLRILRAGPVGEKIRKGLEQLA
ncbi:MAG: pyridine nucleotide-disulfide oxidoreductase [Clostridiales bacterium]|nr:pyridine nucleotide-disulfide oxidoreductase [Clostridiales bacterium]